jgi:hypothetical protein
VLTVGSFRTARLSEMEVCRLYVEGFSRTEIGWRSRQYDREIIEILQRNGVPLRTSTDSQALARARRLRRKEQLAGLSIAG